MNQSPWMDAIKVTSPNSYKSFNICACDSKHAKCQSALGVGTLSKRVNTFPFVPTYYLSEDHFMPLQHTKIQFPWLKNKIKYYQHSEKIHHFSEFSPQNCKWFTTKFINVGPLGDHNLHSNSPQGKVLKVDPTGGGDNDGDLLEHSCCLIERPHPVFVGGSSWGSEIDLSVEEDLELCSSVTWGDLQAASKVPSLIWNVPDFNNSVTVEF